MIQINQLKLSLEQCKNAELEKEALLKKCAQILHVSKNEIKELTIEKKSLDARKKPVLFYVYSVAVAVASEEKVIKKCKDKSASLYYPSKYHFDVTGMQPLKHRPIIIGLGPAGLFCGYMLAKHGYRPIIFERGCKVEDRIKDVQEFWENGKLMLNSNVQFGEGGAGTFSDGKLNTLIKDKTGRNKEVLRVFVECGAPEQILYDNKPHIGTDILMKVVANMRDRMISYGAEIHYKSQATDFVITDGMISGVQVNETEFYEAEAVILAIGHSARDTFLRLYEREIPMAAKDFAVGFRVQHPQVDIDLNQYGSHDYDLPAAAYKLAAQTSSGRGVYSFCMCPGGYVVNASSEEDRLVVNGMSYSGRDSGVANSAIIISVNRNDFEPETTDIDMVHPLAGVAFQRQLEESAFKLANGKIPVQYFDDFCNNQKSDLSHVKSFEPKFKGAYEFVNLREVLPEELNTAFVEGMHQFGKYIQGFDDSTCLLAGVESRTSSPVRIHRDLQCESSIAGLYPCGEGAGYAGGITSAAMDGLAVAEAIAKKYIP